jgi:Transglycosylase SLT domain
MPEGFKVADAYVEVDVDQDELDEAIAEVEAKLQAIKDRAVTVGIEDIAGLTAEIETIQAMLDELQGRADISVNTAELLAQVAEIKAALDALQGRYNIRVDTSDVLGSLAALFAETTALRAAMSELGGAAGGVGDDLLAAAAAAGESGDRAAIAGSDWSAFGLTLHDVRMYAGLSFEALSILVPATIAFGAAAADAAQGATWIADRLQATYETTEATASMFHETAGQALGLSDSLQQAQNAADPLVYEALGGVLNGLRGAFLNLFGGEGMDVLRTFDTFIAKMDIDLSHVGDTLSNLTGKGAGDLQMLGQILGNLGHVILNMANAAPGVAEAVLGIVDALSRLLEIVSSMPVPLLSFVMALEGAHRYIYLLGAVIGGSDAEGLTGGLARLIGKLGNAVQALKGLGTTGEEAGTWISGAAEAMGSFGEFLMSGWGVAVAGAVVGVAMLIDYMAHLKSAAQQSVDAMSAAIGRANFAQGLEDAITDLNTLSGEYERAAAASDNATQRFMAAGVASRYLGPELSATSQAAITYQQAMQHLTMQIADALSMSYSYQGQTYSLSQTIGLATAAGLNLNTAFDKQGHLTAVAKQQIDNLIVGYQEMGQTGSNLDNDIQAINVQTLLQQTDVSKLNAAWDSFIQLLTSGTSDLAQFVTGLATMGQVSSGAGSNATQLSLGVSGISQALTTMNYTGAEVWQNFDQQVTNARNVMDFLNNAQAEGALNNAQWTEGIKEAVAELVPYAANSTTAQHVLLGLASQGDGNISTFKGLTQWVGNTSDATKSLNGVVDTATDNMSNLNAVAQNLSDTLNSEVDQALSQGAVNFKGIADATTNYKNAVQTAGGSSTQAMTAVKGLGQQLYDSGVNADNAKSIVYQLSLQFGDNQTQASNAATAVYNYIKRLQQIPTKETSIVDVSGSGTWSIVGPGQVSAPGGGHIMNTAFGTVVPGYAPGHDSVLAMLSPGEAVLVPELVRHLGPGNIIEWNRIATLGRRTQVAMGGGHGQGLRYRLPGSASGLRRHGLMSGLFGFQAGGVVPDYSDGAPGLGNWAVSDYNATVYQVQQATAKATYQGMQAAAASAAAAAGGGPISGSASSAILQALVLAGAPSSWAGILGTLVSKESSGNPNAIDPISVGGQHAEGMWQMLPSTFAMYAAPSWSIWNPVQEGAAAIRYIMSRYGTPYAIPGLTSGTYVGYQYGGVIPPGTTGVVGEAGPEYARALPGGGTQVTPMGGHGKKQIIVNQNFYGTQYPTVQQQAQMRMELSTSLGSSL